MIICAGSAEFGGSVQAETVTAQQFIDGDGNVMGSFDASKPIGSLTIRDLTAHKLTSIGHTKLSTVTANVIEADDITVKNDISLEAADCAEFFDVATEDLPEPGTVMVAARSDGLLPCRYGYDTAVVGVVSGASDRRPGIVLGKRDHGREGALVALTGTVYCKADADHAPINVGDLLTTSPTVGHAMKAVDPSRRSGAVIGKALRSLSEGCGMVPVIVSLQ